MRALLLGVVCAAFAVTSGHTQTTTPRTAPPVPVIVELFTSEGCSSCPPADRLLTELVTGQPVKNALIIGLSEHVDYWDNLGWKDPFSNHQFTERQSKYAAAHGGNETYTPQMIVDGQSAFVGSERSTALAAIARSAATTKTPVSLAWTSLSPRTLKVTLTNAAAGASVFLAVVEDGLQTNVRAGENSGELLKHSAVTRRLTEIGRADRNGTFSNDVRVTFAPEWRVPGLQVVVFSQPIAGAIGAAGSIRP